MWTHGKFGALIDGCLMHKEAPVTIDDDACLWRAVVSPGVKVGRRVTVLPGSILTRDAPDGSCFGGVPAVDLSAKVKTYRKVTTEEQFDMMKGFAADFLAKEYRNGFTEARGGSYLVKSRQGTFRLLLKWEVRDEDLGSGQGIVVGVEDRTTARRPGVSFLDIAKRTYTKLLTEPEVMIMWFLLESRARFIPA